jgi:hypothetical protein
MESLMKNVTELKYPLDEVKKVIHKWFYIENDSVIDVIVAGYIANRFKTDPLWIIIIAPPSNTKTELLRSFDGHKNAFFISNLTPSTLVSGMKTKPEPSLLPKLNDKMVILKDFTTILSMRSENQQEVLAQFRETYDGQYSKVFGNGKELNWKGRFGLIAACTPKYDSHHAVIGSMGERFLLYRTGSMNGAKMGLQAQRIVGKEDKMRDEIRAAVHKFINQFDDLKVAHIGKDEDVNNMIVALACFCAYGRCPVERDHYDRHVKYDPVPEGTPRLVKQFTQIGIGLALAHGKSLIDLQIYETIKKIGRDLIPTQRLRIMKYLWDQKAFEYLSGWEKTLDIADAVNMPGGTAKLILEDLMTIGVLNRERGESDGGRPPYLWQLSDQFCQMAGGAEVFD